MKTITTYKRGFGNHFDNHFDILITIKGILVTIKGYKYAMYPRLQDAGKRCPNANDRSMLSTESGFSAI